MNVERAAVIGAGAMGSGIAQVLSQKGIEVILKDIDQAFVEKGLASIKRMYDSRVKKETLTQAQADQLFAKVKGSTSFDGFDKVDLVIEAALETIDVKVEIFRELDKICPSKTILASNTSALSVSQIAQATKRPEKVLGMHFFNPAQAMKLVEVIEAVRTAPETMDAAVKLCKELDKIPVRVKECPGFLVNRLLFPYMNEALYALQEGAASVAEIDKAVEAFGLPMGPFALLDLTGADICFNANEFLYSQYGERFRTAPLLGEMMAAGQLGQKSGAGFYVHPKGQPASKDEPKQINPELSKLVEKANKKLVPGDSKPMGKQHFDAYRVILPMFNEAVYALQENVVQFSDIDIAMQYGCGLKRGLMTLASEKGLAFLHDQLTTYQNCYGERFRPHWMLSKLVRAGAKSFDSVQLAPQTVR